MPIPNSLRFKGPQYAPGHNTALFIYTPLYVDPQRGRPSLPRELSNISKDLFPRVASGKLSLFPGLGFLHRFRRHSQFCAAFPPKVAPTKRARGGGRSRMFYLPSASIAPAPTWPKRKRKSCVPEKPPFHFPSLLTYSMAAIFGLAGRCSDFYILSIFFPEHPGENTRDLWVRIYVLLFPSPQFASLGFFFDFSIF